MAVRLITVAPNGARKLPHDHARVPITPEDIAEEARQAADAGASLLHLHVRNRDGSHSLDPAHYREAMSAVRSACGDRLMVQITTESAGVFGWHDQVRAISETSPDAASVALRELCPSQSAQDRLSYAGFIADCRAEKVWLQHILYDLDDIAHFNRFLDEGIYGPRPFALLVVGRYSAGMASTPADLDLMCDALSDRCEWAACAFGVTETALLDHALSRGGHVRVGFENNLLHADGSVALGNADRVAAVAALLTDRGIRPMARHEIADAFPIA